jgi:hypothetical protein
MSSTAYRQWEILAVLPRPQKRPFAPKQFSSGYQLALFCLQSLTLSDWRQIARSVTSVTDGYAFPLAGLAGGFWTSEAHGIGLARKTLAAMQ